MYNVTVYALPHDAAVAPYFGFFRRLAMVLALPLCQILQVITRWKALAEIYAIHSFAPFLDTIFEKPGQKEPGQNTPLKR